MRFITKFSVRMVAAFAVMLCSALLRAQQPSGQWDFNNGDLSATLGAPLQYVDGPGGATQQATQFGTTASFAIPDIAGAAAQVMKFPSNSVSMGYSMPTPAAANGGGSLVNQWTLIMDLLFTGQSHSSWRALIQTDPDGSINADAELFINPANGIGIAGAYEGLVKSNTWHRIAFVVDQSDGGPNQIRKYIDGVEVGVQKAGGIDGRWALAAGATATLFTDNDGEANGGYVNSIQLRAEALSKAQMAAFADPTAAGIPSALPAIPSFVDKWIPPGDFASRDTAIGAVIDTGSTTIQDSSISLQLDGQPVASPSITRAGGLITVKKDNPGLFVSGTKYTITVTLTDSLAGLKTFTHTFEAALFFEDFENLALGPNVDEAGLPNPEDNLHVWTNKPPTGWTVDNSQFPATIISVDNPDDDGDGFPDLDGRTEWAGWSFAKKEFWLTADDQRRSEFSLATGTVAITDPDEWDDQPHFKSLYNSLLITPPISLAGLSANAVFLRFSSSWRPEAADDVSPADSTTGFPGDYTNPDSPRATNNQTALITVKYDNNPGVQVLKFDSISGSPTFHPDSVNESVLVPLNNPAGATNMVISFGMLYAANDWWWAIDNIIVSAGATPPAITQQPANVEVNEGQPVSLTVGASGQGLSYQWFKGQGTGKTAIAGATSATYDVAAAKVEDAGYYSADIKNSVGSTTSGPAKVTVLPNTIGRLVLLDENFDSVPLGPPVEEALAGDKVWTKTGPAGWSIDDTGVPGVGTDQDGRTEWAGWSFADRAWWAQTAGDQQRTLFTKGTGASAIADSDTWDDGGPAAGNMATYLKTKPISLQGVKPKSVILKYDSSWRPENPQKASVTVSFDGGAPVEVLRYDSDPNNPNYRPDEVNETISLKIANPSGATNMVIVFGYFETRNNWWWAIDNLLVLGDTAPLFFEDFDGLALGANQEEGIATGSGGPQTAVWTKTPPAGWSIDDSGVPGVGTDQDGVTEWAGWSFASRTWWAQTAGDQRRTEFTKGTGAVAIADSDEWDDIAHAPGKMATYLSTSAINIAGQGANTLVLNFDSSWRDEPTQTANIRVSYDGGAPIEVLRWESVEGGPNFHDDNVNETVTVPLQNPAGATSMKITFGYFDTLNNWWWAIDNLEVTAGSTQPPPPEVTISGITSVANTVTLNWIGGTAPYLVQMKASLSDSNWFNVLTTSAQSATVAKVGAAAFFRVSDQATAVVIPLAAELSGTGEVPAVTTEGGGLGMFSLEGDTLSYRISFGGLSGNATAAHIHGPAEVTVTAPVIIPFTVGAASEGIISGSVTVTADQKTNLLSGKTYGNVHTAAHPTGEIRGQINLAQFTAQMTGSGEVPAVTTPARGDGVFALIGNQLFYNISFSGLSTNATAAHIHGAADISGTAPVIIPFTVGASTSGTIAGTATLTADQLANLVSGKTYANIHTGAHPTGEIRGQVVTLLLKATLSGAAEVPGVATTASGAGVFALTGNQLNYAISYSGLSGDATASHIHGPAAVAATAPVIIPFTVSAGTSGTIAGTVAVTSDQLTYFLTGKTYANIHTAANPTGEIRGQIAP
ncbi:MAG: CHRD domain-containing protein [Verrucomicrobiota bacterium]